MTHPEPSDLPLPAWLDTLDADAREFFEERAAIVEYEGGVSRAEAEIQAQALTQAYQARRDQTR